MSRFNHMALFAMAPLAFAVVTPVAADPVAVPDQTWSESHAQVAPRAVMPRQRFADEFEGETIELDEAWEAGIRTSLRRISHMAAGASLESAAERQAHCAAVGNLVEARFRQTEGRAARHPAGGLSMQSREQLLAACHDRAYRLSGFHALTINAIAMNPDLVQVTTCFIHNRLEGPAGQETGGSQQGGQAVPQVSVETVRRQPDRSWKSAMQVALDGNEALIHNGCAAE